MVVESQKLSGCQVAKIEWLSGRKKSVVVRSQKISGCRVATSPRGSLHKMWKTKNDSCVAVSKMFYEYSLEEAAAMTVRGVQTKVATEFRRAVKA